MTKGDIEQLITESGADIIEWPFIELKACTLDVGGAVHVGIAMRLTERRKKACLAHELGHIKRGGLYRLDSSGTAIGKAEYLANRYAAELLAPPAEIRRALRQGCRTPWELAERFEIPCDVMVRILNMYKAVNLL